MTAVRHIIRRHRAVAALLIVAALALRLIVPAGFMPVAGNGTVTIQICTGAGPMTVEMPGMPGHGDDTPARAGTPCAFADLAMPLTHGADAPLLAAAIAFVMAVGRAPTIPAAVRTAVRLRPPPIGPPQLP